MMMKPPYPLRRCYRAMRIRLADTRKDAAGFTLMELLIVLGVLLVLTVIIIPNVAGMKISANENSAIASLRAIYESEVQYQSTYPANGFACSLNTLGGPHTGAPSPQQARVLQSDLASGRKSGYVFAIVNCAGKPGTNSPGTNSQEQYTSFEVTAVPQEPGKTGHRGFCIDQQGETKADQAGGTNCTQSLQ